MPEDWHQKMVPPGASREAVAHAPEQHGLSERRACSLVRVSRNVIRYEPTRPDDGVLQQRLREPMEERSRLGYLLAREGIRSNHKSCCASNTRKGCACVALAFANGNWARADQWYFRTDRTSVVRSTSYPTVWSAGAESASCA